MPHQKLLVRLGIVIDRDGQDIHLGHLLLQIFQAWQLLQAGSTPCCPEIQHDHLTVILLQVNGCIGIVHGELRRRFSNLLRVVAAIATGKQKTKARSRKCRRKPHTLSIIAAMDALECKPLELAVLIPARNEKKNLERCVLSLVAQSEEGFCLGQHWILCIVDDHSEDDTRRIAERLAASYAGIIVLEAPARTAGGKAPTGKNAALWHGVQQPQVQNAAWILFTDADTEHRPEALHRAIVEADRHQLSLLSYSPKQETSGWLQRAIMPLVFSELASAYPPKKVNDPSSPIAAANGQFLLVKRVDYMEVGGHRAVEHEVLEDVALAKRMKRRYAIRLRYAPEAISTHMYDTFGDMWRGWTKNLALLFANPLMLAMNRLIDLLLIVGLPLGMVAIPYLVSWQKAALGVLWIRVLFRYYNRVVRSNFSVADCILSGLGLPLFIAMLVRSWQKVVLLKRVEWKGRAYRT